MKLPWTLLTNAVVGYQMLLKWISLFLAGIHCFTEFVIHSHGQSSYITTCMMCYPKLIDYYTVKWNIFTSEFFANH